LISKWLSLAWADTQAGSGRSTFPGGQLEAANVKEPSTFAKIVIADKRTGGPPMDGGRRAYHG